MLFRSRGEGGWRAPEGSGTVEASLSGLVPWAGLRRDGSPALWAAAGTGRGELTLAPEGGEPAAAGLRWSMAAAGAAGAPATVDALGGARVGWRADAMAARTTSEAAAGLAASGTGTTRLRLGLEAAWAGTLSPRLEIGLRHDGGDAETGFGLEAGGGVRFEDPARGLSASLDGRALALHEDGDLEDWGVSVTLEWDPRPETRLGPSMVATRGWGGAASGGVDALLGPETVPGLAAADGGAWSLEAAYGLRRGNGMAGVPSLRVGGTDGLEELRLGYRIAPDADRAADASAEIWAEPGVGGNRTPRRRGARVEMVTRRPKAPDAAAVPGRPDERRRTCGQVPPDSWPDAVGTWQGGTESQGHVDLLRHDLRVAAHRRGGDLGRAARQPGNAGCQRHRPRHLREAGRIRHGAHVRRH